MKTGLLIALGVAVAVALGWMGTRKKEEPQPAPEPKPEPKPEPVAEPELQAAAPSEKPTLVMSPEEAQQAAIESMASTEPTVTPEEPTQEPAAAEEAPAELEAATEGALADDSGDEVELESTADEDPSEAETVLAPVEVPAATENPAGGNAVVCLLDVAGGDLSVPNRATLSAAQQVASARGANLHVVCMGADTSSAANASAEGVTAVHAITHDQLGDGVAETYYAAAMQALTQVAADVVIAPSSSVGKGYLPRPRRTARLRHGDRDFIGRVGRHLHARPVGRKRHRHGPRYRPTGRLRAQATGFEPAATQAADVQAIDFEPPQTKTRFVGREKTESARPDLSEASVVVSGGRGTKGDFARSSSLQTP